MTFRRIPRYLSSLLIGSAAFAMLTLAASSVATAQRSTDLSAIYGRGVHAYFSGQTFQSERILSQVIDAGSQDPRAYYFRGLARLRQGRRYEGEMDFRVGASYEARRAASTYDVGRALMRIQGANRQLIETQRRNAQLAYASARAQEASGRIEQVTRNEGATLRQKPVVALDELLSPSRLSAGASDVAAPSSVESQQAVAPNANTQRPAQEAGPSLTGPADAPDSPAPTASTPVDEDPFGGDAATDDPFNLTDDPEFSGSASPSEDASSDDADRDVASVFGTDSERDAADSPAELDFLASDEETAAVASDETVDDLAVDDESKMEAGRLASILSRVLGRASGVSNLADVAQGMSAPLEAMGDATGSQPAVGEFDLGPEPGGPEVQATDDVAGAETSGDDLDALFGLPSEDNDASTDVPTTPASDEGDVAEAFGGDDDNPFGSSGDDEFPFGTTTEDSSDGGSSADEPSDSTSPAESEEEAPLDDDDPFGDFDNPFGE